MRTRQIIFVTVMTVLLFTGVMLSLPTVTLAIGEVTPTPPSLSPPSTDIDIEQTLDDALNALSIGNFDEAFELSTQVIQADPENADAYFIRGVTFAQDGDFNSALGDFTQYLEIRPFDWQGYVLRGDTYVRINELGEALRDYNRAVYVNPRFQEAFAKRAQLQSALGNELEATVDALIAQGISLASFGDNNGAVDSYTDAIVAAEDNPFQELAGAYYNRALALNGLGLVNDAIDDYGRAIELYPEFQDAYMGRGFTYAAQGDGENAGKDFYQRMTLLERDSEDHTMNIGEIKTVDMEYGKVQRLQFEGQAGDTITISARAADNSGVDPLLVLLDPAGNPIMGNDDGGGALDSQIPSFELPESGTFTIMVSHANGGFEGPINVTAR